MRSEWCVVRDRSSPALFPPTPVRAGLAQRLTTTARNFDSKPAPTIPN
ncbi:hypothetical protein [Chroococcidiopsis sp. SAG 2025]|nr:hypothetical protein [Chroococcidiopsis sp. SAG 2025]